MKYGQGTAITRGLLVITFLQTMGSYLFIPLYASYLFDLHLFSSYQVALLIGMSALAATFFSPVLSFFATKMDHRQLIIGSFFVLALTYFLIIYTKNYYVLLFFGIAMGLSEVIINSLLKSYLSQIMAHFKADIFRIRYNILCAGIIIAPMIGNLLRILGNEVIIFVASFCMMSAGLLCYFVLKTDHVERRRTVAVQDLAAKDSVYISNWKKRCLFLLVSISLITIFAVFESGTPLVLKTWTDNVYQYFSFLIVLNSIIVIVITPLTAFIVRTFQLRKTFMLGYVFFFITYVLFIYSDHSMIVLVMATICFSFAESLTLPTLDVIVGHMSQKGDAGTLYAMFEFKQVGFFLAPLFVSWGLTLGGRSYAYILTLLLIMASYGLFECFQRTNAQ